MKTIESILEQFWPEWKLESLLGTGIYSKVYQAVREDADGQARAAIKVVQLCMDTLRCGCESEEDARAVFDRLGDRFRQEIRVMMSLKGQTNLVNIDDCHIVDEGDTCYFFLRMELLTPLSGDPEMNDCSEERLIRLGTDLCRGLEAFENGHIVHQNVKPGNIYVDRQGNYKLGSCSIMARSSDMASEPLITLGYGNPGRFAAPEVIRGQMCNAGFEEGLRADIYSLGMILYWIANRQCPPFLYDRQSFSVNDRCEAELRRLSGESLPELKGISPGLQSVIFRACAFESAQRYGSAGEFREALERLSGAGGERNPIQGKKRRLPWLRL